MNGIRFSLDTNFILDYFKGLERAVMCFNRMRPAKLFVSEIAEMELLSYPIITEAEKEQLTGFLSNLNIQPMNNEIKKHAIALRRITRRKLPDAIIAATAIWLHAPLITSDLTLAATVFPGFHALTPDEIAKHLQSK